MSSGADNGHEDGDFDPETGEPLGAYEAPTATKAKEPAPPKRRRSTQAQQQASKPDVLDQVAAQAAQQPDVLQELLAQQAATLTVTRLECNTDYEGSRENGRCGAVPATPEYMTEIQQRWGGGRYRITGTTRDGRAVTAVTDPIPGRSHSLSEDEAEELENERERLRRAELERRARPQGYVSMPGYPPRGPAQHPGGPEVPEYFQRAWHPNLHAQRQQEVDQLKERIVALERELLTRATALENEKLLHERTKGELLAAKEQAKTESLKRDFDKQVAELRSEMAKRAVPDTSQRDALAMIMEQNKAAESARQAAADRESRAREAEATRQQQFMTAQQQAVRDQIVAIQTAAASKNPNEVLELATKLATQFSKQASPIEQFREFAAAAREFAGKDDDEGEDDDEDLPWWQQALKKLPEALDAYRETRQGQGMQAPALPGPQAQQQQGQQPQGNNMSGGALLMIELVDQVIEQAADGAAPAGAAQKQGGFDLLEQISSVTPAEIAATLKAQANSVKARTFLPGEQIQKLLEFSLFLETERGGTWAGTLLEVLRGSVSKKQ